MADAKSKPITVVYIDDDDHVRYALGLMLKDPEIDVVAACETAAQCLEAVQRHRPQVALVDLLLDGDPAAGIALIREIKSVCPSTACAVLTASASNGEYLLQALQAGAEAYYSKRFAKGEEVPIIVKSLAEGDPEFDPRFTKQLAEYARGKFITMAGMRKAEAIDLTDREREVLHLMAEGRKTGDIARILCISEQTVKSHKKNMTAKLRLANQGLLLVYAVLERYLVQPLTYRTDDLT